MNSSESMALTNSMNESERLARGIESSELVFPDWSGMDNSSARITPAAALRLCEQYPRLLAKFRKDKPEPRLKESLPEFVL